MIDSDYAILLFVRTHQAQHRRKPTIEEIAEVRGLPRDAVVDALFCLTLDGHLPPYLFPLPVRCPECGQDGDGTHGWKYLRTHMERNHRSAAVGQ